jgi:CRP-like cAMP-binding protein
MIGELFSSALGAATKLLPGGGGGSPPEVIEALKKIDIFDGIQHDERALGRIGAQAERKRFEQGQILVEEGKQGLGMFAIVSGKVVVEVKGTKVNELDAGAVVAEMSLLDDKPRSATVRATEATDTLLFTRDVFRKLVNQTPQLGLGLARNLAERLRVANEAAAKAAKDGGSSKQLTEAATDAEAANPLPPPRDQKPEEPKGKGAKLSVQDSLLKVFDRLYTAKAITRFSVAVIGCPVEGVTPDKLGEIRIGEVKAVAIPRGAKMDLVASEPGVFTLHVFQPDAPAPARYGPTPLRPGQACRLTLTPRGPRITLDGNRI